jgi:hypothetical protein
MVSPRVFMLRTNDYTPPVFTNSTPTVTNTYYTAARVLFELDEAAVVYYGVQEAFTNSADRSTEPPSPELLRKAGLSMANHSRIVAAGHFNVSSAYSPMHVTVSGLHSLTNYTLWATAEDKHGNLMKAATQRQIITLDDQAPEFMEFTTQSIGPYQVDIVLQLDEPGAVAIAMRQLQPSTVQTEFPKDDQESTCPSIEDFKSWLSSGSVSSAVALFGTVLQVNSTTPVHRY